jgi:hypothetical protein
VRLLANGNYSYLNTRTLDPQNPQYYNAYLPVSFSEFSESREDDFIWILNATTITIANGKFVTADLIHRASHRFLTYEPSDMDQQKSDWVAQASLRQDDSDSYSIFPNPSNDSQGDYGTQFSTSIARAQRIQGNTLIDTGHYLTCIPPDSAVFRQPNNGSTFDIIFDVKGDH